MTGSPSSRSTSVQWRGREVERQPQRALLVILGAAAAVAGLTLAILVVAVALVAIPVVVVLTLPIHLLLRLIGRKGFVVWDRGGLSYNVNRDGFRRFKADP